MRQLKPWSVLPCLVSAAVLVGGCDDGANPDPDPVLRTLSVTLDGEGTGTVTSDPAGLACTSADRSCTAEFEEGTTVTLTAEPDPGQEFTGWAEACTGRDACSITVTGDAAVAAGFAVIPSFAVTVHWVGDGTGRVTSTPAGIDCPSGSACSADFLRDTEVTLTATPDDGSDFVAWGGFCTGTDASCALVVEDDHPVSAEFNDPTVTRQTVGPGGNVVTSEDGGLTLAIPAGALSEEQTITVRQLDPADLPEDIRDLAADPGVLAAYDLGPDGLEFDEPVTATVNTGWVPELEPGEMVSRVLLLQGSDGRELGRDQVSYLDPGTRALMVRGELDHFSKIVIAEAGGRIEATYPDAVLVGQEFWITLSVRWNLKDDFIPSSQPEGTWAMDESGAPLVAQFEGSVPMLEDGPASYVHSLPYVCTAVAEGAPLRIMLEGRWTEEFRATSISGPVEGRIQCIASHRLTVTWDGDGYGHVTSTPTGIDCPSGSDCSAVFEAGTQVTLTATPNDGSRFCGWTGGRGQTESSPTIQVTMDTDGSVTACFEKDPEIVELRFRLDYARINADDGVVPEGEQSVDLLDGDGAVVGTAVLRFQGPVFVDPERGVIGVGTDGRVTWDLAASTWPNGTPPPDQGVVEIDGRDNPSKVTVQFTRYDAEGNIIEQGTTEIRNDLFSFAGAQGIVLLLQTANVFFDFAMAVLFQVAAP